MSDVDQFKLDVDRLESGLPEQPDLQQIRDTARRHRRRRTRLTVASGAVLAAVLALPAFVLVGSDDSPDTVDAASSGSDTNTDTDSSPAGPAVLAGPEFGLGMRAATAAGLPDAEFDAERLADHWIWSERFDAYDFAVHDPPRWSTLYQWTQHYDLPGVRFFTVIASRESPQPPVDPADYGFCREGLFAVEKNCREWAVGGRHVVVHDGTRSIGEASDQWSRMVEVFGPDGSREMRSRASVTGTVTGETWAEARAKLPAIDDFVGIALDERLILPEPERYPPDPPME